jgi:hypothetical protein
VWFEKKSALSDEREAQGCGDCIEVRMNTVYRIRAILVLLFGAYCLLTVLYFLGRTAVQGLSSGVWHLVSFGEACGDPHTSFGPGIVAGIFSTIWNAPYVLVATVISISLIWQGLRALSYPP